MATLLSNPTTMSLQAAGNAVLSQLAASMSAGTWAQLAVGNQNSVLGGGGDSGSHIHFCNGAAWNPFSRRIEIIGQDHGWPGLRHMAFDLASNQFVLVMSDAGLGAAHGYDHYNVNPFNGDLYYRYYSAFSGKIRIARKAYGASSFVQLASTNATDQVAIGTCWWSGPASFASLGPQGAFLVYNSGNAVSSANDGEMMAYSASANAWVWYQNARSPNYGSDATYHSVCEYSANKNVAVYGGGNVASNRLWKMSATGAVTALANSPAPVGVQLGNLVNDPVSGNFLLLSSNGLWELNPDGTGTWRALTGSRTPPANMNPTGGSNGVLSCALPEYNVVAYIQQTSSNGGTFYLYKHA